MRKNHYHEEMLSVEDARKKILENFSILSTVAPTSPPSSTSSILE